MMRELFVDDDGGPFRAAAEQDVLLGEAVLLPIPADDPEILPQLVVDSWWLVFVLVPTDFHPPAVFALF